MRTWAVPVLLLLSVSFTGCLGDDIWREPFDWVPVASLGQDQDAAQALAGALANLDDQTFGTTDDVIDTVDALPDNVVFQNAKQFLNDQSEGSGDQFDEGAHTVVATASGTYYELTGELAAAVGQVTGPLGGTGPVTFEVPERSTRVRWALDVALTGQEAPEPGQNPTPLGVVVFRIYDPSGALKADYSIDTSRSLTDQAIEGTWGDRNDVRQHLGGTWRVEVDANAEGAWSLVFDAYAPEYDDWKPWQFWRAERREVTGE